MVQSHLCVTALIVAVHAVPPAPSPCCTAQVVLGLLSRHLAKEGLYPGVWAAQTHRVAVTLAAVMALHNDLRSDLVQVWGNSVFGEGQCEG